MYLNQAILHHGYNKILICYYVLQLNKLFKFEIVVIFINSKTIKIE